MARVSSKTIFHAKGRVLKLSKADNKTPYARKDVDCSVTNFWISTSGLSWSNSWILALLIKTRNSIILVQNVYKNRYAYHSSSSSVRRKKALLMWVLISHLDLLKNRNCFYEGAWYEIKSTRKCSLSHSVCARGCRATDVRACSQIYVCFYLEQAFLGYHVSASNCSSS